jgi:phthiodiolone/phenolphthiodiolone dimycocerosates ketoreductase
MSMSAFRVGLADQVVNSRFGPTALSRANYLTAVASGRGLVVGAGSSEFVVSASGRPRYPGAAKLLPKIDAYLEPWTMLGHLASRNRFARLRLGIGVTDASRRNPAVTPGSRRCRPPR